MRSSVAAFVPTNIIATIRGSCSDDRFAQHQHEQQQRYRPSLVCFQSNEIEWEVWVDQSKASLERGGSATLDAFWGLAPASRVRVRPAVLSWDKKKKSWGSGSANGSGSSNSSNNKSQQPAVRCRSLRPDRRSIQVGNVDSVEKVYRILTKHMQIEDIDVTVCDCLQWKYRGNGHLEAGNIGMAIDAYDRALAISTLQQEGMIRLLRANALMQRASGHRQELKRIVGDLVDTTTSSDGVAMRLRQQAALRPGGVANAIFRRITQDTLIQEGKFRQTQYRHGLYQYALQQAAIDVLRATELLPSYAMAWQKAGDILASLWKINDCVPYYERAMELDPALQQWIPTVIQNLRKRQELLADASTYGWSEETLRLALDVAKV